MTKDEMIRYYAKKIVEKGLKDCWGYNIIVSSNDFGQCLKYKNEILEYIAKDERIADIEIDSKGDFDIVFYSEYMDKQNEEEL